ncbi:MAG: WD40 repeat domain-containing protein [Anaerolineaceae bacterium]
MVNRRLPPEQITLLSDALHSGNPLERLPADQQVLYILKGIVFSLEQDGSPDTVDLLFDASLSCPYEEIQRLAVSSLEKLAQNGNLLALKNLFHLAIYSEKSGALQVIAANNFHSSDATTQAVYDLLEGNLQEYQQNDPEYLSLTHFYLGEIPRELSQRICLAAQIAGLNNWVLIASAIKNLTNEASNHLVDHYSHLIEKEKRLLLQFLDEKTGEGSEIAGDTLCKIFIYQDEAAAAHLAAKNGFLPRDLQQRALFLFLSERWDDFERVDFNQTLLSSAYETAAPNLRKKLLDLSRYSGLTGWTKQLSTRSHLRWLGDLNDADWETMILGLKTSGQFEDMWKLAQVAPPVWSAFLINTLFENKWESSEVRDSPEWDVLTNEAALALQNTPKVQLSEAIQIPSGSINALALSPDGRLAALGGAETLVQIFNLATRKVSLNITSPSAQIRAMVFHPGNQFIAIAAGDNNIHVFELPSGKKIKSLEGHTGHIRALDMSPDGRLLFSASFDGTIRLWRFPQGAELNRLPVNNTEWFSVCLGLGAETLLTAGVSQKIQVWKLPEGVLLRELEGHNGTVTLLAVANSSNYAASYSRDQDIFVWNYASGKILHKITVGNEVITALSIHPDEQFIISGNYKGEISFWNISTGSRISQLVAHDKPIIGLAVTPDGRLLLSCSSDGCLCLWNLSTFTLIRLPIGTGKGGKEKLIDEIFRQGGLSDQEKRWLNFTRSLIHLRHRFDILIDEAHPIHVGEFDIEL